MSTSLTSGKSSVYTLILSFPLLVVFFIHIQVFSHFFFRFEEPDPDFIKRFPRTIKDSMRREENSRKRKRDEVKERKEREKETRAQELKQLKAMKKKEILDKMDKLKKIAGTEGLNFQVNLQRVYGSLID